MLVANRLMDPSSETTYAMLGIGVSESYPAQFLSSHALLQEQISRRLKTDTIPTEDGQLHQMQKKKRKKRGKECVCVCMCENIEKLGYGGAATVHVEHLKSNVSGADCYNVFVMVDFSPKARQALAY